MTAKELIDELRKLSPDTEISFVPLHFYRLKVRGDKYVHVEFEEKEHSQDDKFITFQKTPLG